MTREKDSLMRAGQELLDSLRDNKEVYSERLLGVMRTVETLSATKILDLIGKDLSDAIEGLPFATRVDEHNERVEIVKSFSPELKVEMGLAGVDLDAFKIR